MWINKAIYTLRFHNVADGRINEVFLYENVWVFRRNKKSGRNNEAALSTRCRVAGF